MAREILEGFGDASLGEWIEDRPEAFHIRRCLTPLEQEGIGEAIACGAAEGLTRLKAIADFIRPQGLMLARMELAERGNLTMPVSQSDAKPEA